MRRRSLLLSGAAVLAAQGAGAQPRPGWLPVGQHLIREFTDGGAPSNLARRREGERVAVLGPTLEPRGGSPTMRPCLLAPTNPAGELDGRHLTGATARGARGHRKVTWFS